MMKQRPYGELTLTGDVSLVTAAHDVLIGEAGEGLVKTSTRRPGFAADRARSRGSAGRRKRACPAGLGARQAAITYYGAYTGEIDQWIDGNDQEAAEAHAAWMAGQAAVRR